EWGKRASSLVVALDDDQAIMEWRGGSPRRMLTLAEDSAYSVDQQILGKSFRVPRAVHAVAERWVRRLSMRQEKEYRPRTRYEPVLDERGQPIYDADGHPIERDTGELVEGAAYCVPESIERPVLVDRIEEEIGRGRSVMVIASCAYMLKPLIESMRACGLPFHNPFRPTESRWNPLRGSSGMSSAERVHRYLVGHPDFGDRARLWTGDDVRAWMTILDAKKAGLRRGVKAALERLRKDELTEAEVASLFADADALDLAVQPDLEWFAGAVMGSKARATAYPLQVARKRGPVALASSPQVVVGTIHSVKGAAADVVYVAPDLSAAGIEQLKTPNGRDQAIRLFYVAMTRAREELRLLAPSGRNYLKRRDLLPSDLEVPA
ncbi:MAG TPA: ATP-binding domain-containing protein, partial [Nocardioides sp.]|nr:ATP-binding domain-containing protein [Nocardioides sp.]